MIPVERGFSGGTVPKKPQPRDYGFSDESEVKAVITAEEGRTRRIGRIRLFSFLFAFVLTAAGVLVLLGSLFLPQSIPSNAGRFLAWLLLGSVSVATGLILGTWCSFIARFFSRRAFAPSPAYAKAKQYLDANRLWKRRLQQGYGYESR